VTPEVKKQEKRKEDSKTVVQKKRKKEKKKETADPTFSTHTIKIYPLPKRWERCPSSQLRAKIRESFIEFYKELAR